MRCRIGSAKVVSLGVMCAAIAIAGRTAADDKPTLSGQWTASAMSESWSTREWGAACGPKPAGRGAGGGSVQISQQGGELSMSGAGRAFSTTECWEQMPGVSRTSHSGGSRGWRTRCSSAPNDPRRATITTSLSATDSTIQMTEIGEFQFAIQDTKCSATVSRSRSFTLVRRDGEAPPVASATPSAVPSASASAAPVASVAAPAASTAAPASKPASRCSGAAGDPTRLEVQPGRKLMRAGDRFAFRAIVSDAEGCATGTRPVWSILPGPLSTKARVDATGAVVVADDAGEGQIEVSASVGGKGVSVIVEVARADRYDALLGATGLNDAGEADQAAVAVIAAGAIGGRTAVGEDVGRERKTRFVAIVAGLAGALAFAALVISRRGKRRVDDGADEAPPSSSYGVEPAPSSRADVAPLSEAPAAPATPEPVAPARTASRGKICPTCGEHYPSDAEFCGKDATQLVLIN